MGHPSVLVATSKGTSLATARFPQHGFSSNVYTAFSVAQQNSPKVSSAGGIRRLHIPFHSTIEKESIVRKTHSSFVIAASLLSASMAVAQGGIGPISTQVFKANQDSGHPATLLSPGY